MDHGGVDGWRKAVNDQFRHLFRADSAGFLLPVPGSAPFFSDEHPPAEIGRYTYTPPPPTAGGVEMWQRVLQVGVGTLETIFEASLPDYFASEYYTDYAAPNKAHDTLGVFVPLAAPMPGVAPGMASVHLWHDSPTGRLFGDRETALMQLLYPAFRAGAEVAMAWARRCDDLVGALDHLHHPAVVADVHAGTLHATPAFEALLASEPEAALVREAVCRALDALDPRRAAEIAPPVRTVRTRRDTYRLRACLYGTATDRPLVVVGVEPSVPAVPPVAEIRERFGLTRRQADVARLLARRATNAEVAEALSISSHTALRHTEAVFAALGVHDRRSAAAALRGDARAQA